MDPFEDDELILRALTAAARDARILHKAFGHSMATWKDGKVVWVQPEDIVIDERERKPMDRWLIWGVLFSTSLFVGWCVQYIIRRK